MPADRHTPRERVVLPTHSLAPRELPSTARGLNINSFVSVALFITIVRFECARRPIHVHNGRTDSVMSAYEYREALWVRFVSKSMFLMNSQKFNFKHFDCYCKSRMYVHRIFRS